MRVVARRLTVPAVLSVVVALSACAQRPSRILFLGNSLTYTGNLPAVLESVCAISGRKCLTEMVAAGGATLSHRVADNTLDRLTQAGGKYDFVLLQERGGDYLRLSFGPDATEPAEKAAETLAQDAKQRGMTPVLLGTYQFSPAVSRDLVAAEARLAGRLDIGHVRVSDALQCGLRRYPSLQWFATDGMHPGADLTLLMATLAHQELFGELPQAASIQAEIQRDRTISYGQETLESILDLVKVPCSEDPP